MTATATANYDLSVDSLRKIKSEISEIDVSLDAIQGGTSGKRSLRNSYVNANEANIEKLAAAVLEQINKYEGTDRIGVFYGVIDRVESALGEELDEELDEIYESQKTEVPELSDDEVETLTERRRALNQSFKTLQEALVMFGNDEAADIDPPKVRRGRKSRGPTVWGKFQYSINGDALPEEANSMGFVAKRAGIKVADIKTAMEEQGIDKKNPPAEFTVSLPNNVEMTAVALDEYVEDFTEETEEEAA